MRSGSTLFSVRSKSLVYSRETVLAAGSCANHLCTPTYLFLPHTFHRLCKVGLGSLGVVTELTLKCIPRFDLCEHTTAATRETIAGTWSVHVLHVLPFRHDTNSSFTLHAPTGTGNAEHARRLQAFRHVRYMWIPYSDTVMYVTSNPVPAPQAGAADGGGGGARAGAAAAAAAEAAAKGVGEAEDERPAGKSTQALCDLLLRLQPSRAAAEVHKVHLMCGYI